MDEVLFGRRVDAPLDEHGAKQAFALSERLADRAIDPLIYASPRRRTRETAETIAARNGADVRVRAELDEIDFGRWSGQAFASLEADAEWRTWNANRAHASTPGGETIAKVQNRVLSLLYEIDAVRPSRPVAIVTHSEIIRSLLFYCLDISPNYYGRLSIDPASVTTIQLVWDLPCHREATPSREGFHVEAVNERFAS